MKKLFACLLVCLFAGSANASLMLNIQDNGPNSVIFSFSGSSAVNNQGYARNGFWFGDIAVNTFFLGSEGARTGLANSFFAQNVTQGTNSTLSDIYLGGGIGHELGIRLTNVNILTGANNGDLVSWSGQTTLNLDFSNFTAGTYTGNRLIANGTDQLTLLSDGYTITVGDVVEVPEPASLALLGLGLAGLGFIRRRRNSN